MTRTEGTLLILFCLIFQPSTRAQQPAAGEDINQQLIEAAEKGDKAAVESLLTHGADSNAKDKKNGRTALMAATEGDHLAVVEALLAAQADVNAKTNLGLLRGLTALTFAVVKNHPPIVERLLAAGADVNAKLDNGYTALMYAAVGAHADMLKVLLAAKADLNAQDSFGRTALMSAVRERASEGIEGSANDSVSPNPPVDSARAEEVRALLAAGADVNAKDHDAATALMFTADSGLREALEVLLAAGADTNVMTSEFEKFKCYSGDVVIQGYSIQIKRPNGVKFTCQTVKMKGWTALKAAKDGHYQDIVELLKKAGAKK